MEAYKNAKRLVPSTILTKLIDQKYILFIRGYSHGIRICSTFSALKSILYTRYTTYPRSIGWFAYRRKERVVHEKYANHAAKRQVVTSVPSLVDKRQPIMPCLAPVFGSIVVHKTVSRPKQSMQRGGVEINDEKREAR